MAFDVFLGGIWVGVSRTPGWTWGRTGAECRGGGGRVRANGILDSFRGRVGKIYSKYENGEEGRGIRLSAGEIPGWS